MQKKIQRPLRKRIGRLPYNMDPKLKFDARRLGALQKRYYECRRVHKDKIRGMQKYHPFLPSYNQWMDIFARDPRIIFLGDQMELLGNYTQGIFVWIKETKRVNYSYMATAIKSQGRMISYDGNKITHRWPKQIKKTQISKHYQFSVDWYSCGFRAYFWAKKIANCGLKNFLRQYQKKR